MITFEQIYSEIRGQVKESLALNFFEAQKNAPNRRVVLYGAGGNCQYAIFACSFFKDIHIACICDSHGGGGTYTYVGACDGKEGRTYQVISPERLLKDYRDALVCVTSWKYEEEIRTLLVSLGFPKEQIFYLRNPYRISPEVFENNYLAGYRWSYDYFRDDRSRQKVANRMRTLLCGDAGSADSLFQDGYTAFPGIHLTDGEVYIDGGAYVGDTAEEFISAMEAAGKRYSRIYSFEPDSHNIKIAGKRLSEYERVELVTLGLWSKPDTLRFSSRDGGGYVGSGIDGDASDTNLASIDKNTSSVRVTSLDDFFKQKPVQDWPTLIKMDIEGAEKEALIGAAEIIKVKKPRLMICAYHKPEDIYELPQTILKIRDDYQLFLWQIGESWWDLMLYAV